PTLVAGAAGFIGHHVARTLLARGESVVGIDNLNAYYDPQLKRDRLAALPATNRFRFIEVDFADHEALEVALAEIGFDRIVHLGAQAGVRCSIDNPRAYATASSAGHVNTLEPAIHCGGRPLVY